MKDLNEIYVNMSEFELAQFYYMSKNQVSMDSAILVSFFFAYLAVAHFAGKQLSTIQVALLGAIYSIIVLFSMTTIYQDIQITATIAAVQLGTEPKVIWAFVMTGIYQTAWVSSLVYMYQVRRSA